MKELLNFLIEVGKLKKIPRKGWVLRGVKNPETIAAHTFRMTIMAWLLCKHKKLNVTKAIKMSLIHDLCEVYAGDTTPYDELPLKSEKSLRKIIQKLPRFSKKQKREIFFKKYQKENKALKKLISTIPSGLKKEIENLWNEYEKGLTREGRFVRQLDRVENLLQALEYQKKNKQTKIKSFWITAEELIDDPVLFEFIEALGKKFRRNS